MKEEEGGVSSDVGEKGFSTAPGLGPVRRMLCRPATAMLRARLRWFVLGYDLAGYLTGQRIG